MRKKDFASRAGDAAADLAALEAFLLATEGLGPEEIDRLNARWGVPPLGEDARRPGPGRMAAGSPLAATLAGLAGPEWRVEPDERFGRRSGLLARILKPSMEGAGLPVGALVFALRPVHWPKPGSIVLADVEGVGRVARRVDSIGGAIVLRPEHPGYLGVGILDWSEAEVFGVVPEPIQLE